LERYAAISATGLAPSDDTEAAIIQSLAPGTYTAVLTDADGGSGIGRIEVYDLSAGGISPLFNISTRGFVGVDDHMLIDGFIARSNNTRVVVRALGPTLQRFGVAGALSDPILMLFDENGNFIASNDNWRDTQADEIEGIGYAPPSPAESAIIVTRPAGNTTAIIRGKNRSTGVALVEVYYLPFWFFPAPMLHGFTLPAGHVQPRALPIALMIGPAKIYFIIFGILTIAGGIVGYVKAGSMASIIAGSISGLLLLLAAWLMPEHQAAGLVIALLVSLLLAAQFIPKFFRTFKMMPAGLMSILSALGIIVAIATWLRK
jgi:uncharacterized membrane protein (UPF0136 family)